MLSPQGQTVRGARRGECHYSTTASLAKKLIYCRALATTLLTFLRSGAGSRPWWEPCYWQTTLLALTWEVALIRTCCALCNPVVQTKGYSLWLPGLSEACELEYLDSFITINKICIFEQQGTRLLPPL